MNVSPKVMREYQFPNATIKVYSSGLCKEFPKWCPLISVDRSRRWVAEALLELREFKRKI